MAEVSRMSPVRRTEIFLICSEDFIYFSLGSWLPRFTAWPESHQPGSFLCSQRYREQ
jgi:hypothetical protein